MERQEIIPNNPINVQKFGFGGIAGSSYGRFEDVVGLHSMAQLWFSDHVVHAVEKCGEKRKGSGKRYCVESG